MQLNVDLSAKLKQYVRPDQPFGPPDAADIKESDCAAALFDWNNQAFAELLTGSDVLVGRRGSGKSALLGTFRSKRHMKADLTSDEAREYRDRFHLNAKTLLAVPDLIVEADTPAHMDELEIYCLEHHLPSVEVLARMWNVRIWVLVGTSLQRDYPILWRNAPENLKAYVADDDVVKTALGGVNDNTGCVMPANHFVADMEAFLRSEGKRCVITFDNLERYKVNDEQNAVLAGLIAATGKMIGAQHPSLDVKLCLPAEIFEHLKTVIFRADKDLQRIQYLHWSPVELMHVAASRLKVYFQLYDPDTYDVVKDLRLSDRSILRKFWNRFLPERIVNALGMEEDTFTYLLRHTQLLPRQVLTFLNAVARRFTRDRRILFTSAFEAKHIVTGVEDAENSNAQAVLAMFQPMYPRVMEIFDVVMPRLKGVFDYGFLQSVYHSSAKSHMQQMQRPDFRSFWRLMLSTGAVGIVDATGSSDIYETGKFEFNSSNLLRVSDKDRLCVHPMFSRIYNVDEAAIQKVVLPRGSDFDLEQN
jgi:hypothetical protein